MKITSRASIRRSWAQTAILIFFLWLLDLIRLEGDAMVGSSFLLFFVILAPHIFNAAPVFLSLIAYTCVAAITGILGIQLGMSPASASTAVQFVSLLLATVVSRYVAGRGLARVVKAILVLYYVGTFSLASNYVCSAYASNPFSLIWLVPLILIPPLIFWRMKAFAPRFWQTAAPVAVYIPVNFLGLALICHLKWLTGDALTGQCAMPAAAFTFNYLVLPLLPALLMALIAAVVLTYLGDWTIRAPEVRDELKMTAVEDPNEKKSAPEEVS